MVDTITKSIIVKASPEEAYSAWSDLEILPKFMSQVKAVERLDEGTTRWVMDAPGGADVAWEAEITRDEPHKRIAWSSKDMGPITTSGQVTFHELPGGGTEVTVMMKWAAGEGLLGTIAEWLSDPEAMLSRDLHNFKAYMEGMPERISR